jgi:Fe-S cluster biogenesis protein NfuA
MDDNLSNSTSLNQRVQQVLDGLRPFIQADGGDVELVSVDQGVVKVRLRGACSGCPMSRMTLQMGIERRLRECLPEIRAVEAVP